MKPRRSLVLPGLSADVLGYLLRNPAAEDTMEGIVEWWLLEQQIMHASVQVRSALTKLCECGFVSARVRADGRTTYHLEPMRRREAEEAWARAMNRSQAQGEL